MKVKGGTMDEKRKLRTRNHAASGLSVGRKGFVRFGKKKRLVRIIEDRGKIGLKGRRIFRVAFSTPHCTPPEQVFEIPADELIQYSPKQKGRKIANVE